MGWVVSEPVCPCSEWAGNGRKLPRNFGLLRNSTKIAAQFLGLGQCSQTAPEIPGKLEQRPDCSQPTLNTDIPDIVQEQTRLTRRVGTKVGLSEDVPPASIQAAS